MSLRNLFAFLVVLGLVFSAPVGTPISACQDITSSGEYYLDTDLSGLYDATDFCLRVGVGDVVLDCDGHQLTGSGTGSGINIKAAGAPGITVKNCVVQSYYNGISGDISSGTISGNTLRMNARTGAELVNANFNRIENNNVSENSYDGFYLNGQSNNFTGNRFFSNYGEGIGLTVKGKGNRISGNFAYDNYGSGFAVSGNYNEISRNTAYGNDWENYEGAGFETYNSAYNIISDNAAYDNTNGFYIAGNLPRAPLSADVVGYGNTVTNNHAYDNLVGMNVIDYNGTYTDNLLEENLEADFLVGGDAWLGGTLRGPMRASTEDVDLEAMCDNIFDNTGSGGRDIYFTNRTVTLTSGTYSEAIICGADNSQLGGLTISGSDELDNNGLLVFFTEGATIESSNSKNNFLGFGFVQSDENTLEGCNSDGSGIGIASVVSKDLTVSGHTSANNKMDSSLLLDLLSMFLGGPILGETALGARETPEVGAGAVLLFSPRATFSSSSFSESTAGALFLMSDESTITGGSAHDNDVLGYAFIDSYNGTMYGASVYGNDGNFYDIFNGRIPPAYESLGLLPLGAGVLDFSTDTLAGLPILGGSGLGGEVSGCPSYSYCEMGDGYICDFDTYRCVEGTFVNKYENSRVYENNYGLVLLNKGHEVADGCRIYDNNVLGILDASDMNARLGSRLGYSVEIPTEETSAITVKDTYMYRNGEQVFATMAGLFEEQGMEGWAKAFRLADRAFPKGMIEFELIEASYIYEMDLPIAGMSASGPRWMLNHSTIGTGTPSVEISLQDEAQAVYIVSDTNLPSIRAIELEDDDLGIDVTLHMQNEGVANKTAFMNKYFMIAAIGENPDLAAMGPQIEQFQVHYGGTSNYDMETMGLYALNFYRQGYYCEEDTDCDYPTYRCYENMCIKAQCETDRDCEVHASAQYCVGYICSSCRTDADCTGDQTDCRDDGETFRCGYAFCISDSECPDGQYCDSSRARCQPDLLGGSRSSVPLPISEIANREVSLRASMPTSGDLILKGRWVPVPMQSNDVLARTITVAPLTQNDRTKFIESIIGDLLPEEILFYGDVYGLFAVRVPGTGDDGEPIDYVCEQDSDCGECEFCSIDNNQCLPKEAAQCGVEGRECREGYTCEQCGCVPPECFTDSDCGQGYKCLDYSCVEEEKPKEEQKEDQGEGKSGETGESGQPGTPPEEVIPEQPEEEKPAYPLVEVEVPSVQAPKQPVSESQVEFQTQQIGVALLLLLGLGAAYLWFKTRGKKGKKGKA